MLHLRSDEICASLELLPTTENRDMKALFIPGGVALLLALSVPALAQVATTAKPKPAVGAPGPLAGASLLFILFCCCIYWLFWRKKGQARNP